MRKGPSWIIAALALTLIACFQNCQAQSKFDSAQPVSHLSATDETGQHYDGKLFVLLGDTCSDGTIIRASIKVYSSTRADLLRDNCADISPVALAASDFQINPQNPDELIYQNQIFLSTHGTIKAPIVSGGSSRISVSFEYSGSAQYLRLFIDTDQDVNTGLKLNTAGGGVIGADFQVTNETLSRYVGDGASFDWAAVAVVPFSKTPTSANWELQPSLIGSPASIDLAGDIAMPAYATSTIVVFKF